MAAIVNTILFKSVCLLSSDKRVVFDVLNRGIYQNPDCVEGTDSMKRKSIKLLPTCTSTK